MVHGEVTFAVLDSEIIAVSRCCLSFAIQHLGPPTEIFEVVVSQCATTLQIVIDDPDPWDDVSALLGP